MKRNIIIFTMLSFLLSCALFYMFVEIVYKERFTSQTKYAQSTIVSNMELILPEIRTAFSKSDDISLLYYVDKISKIKNVQEAFVIDSDLTVLIHNDSTKWNKKYDYDFYRDLLKQTEVAVQNIDANTMIYSLPLNEKSVLCVKFSLQSVYNSLKMLKMKLYVYGFVIVFLMFLITYYLLKFFFLYPFNRTKKYLSLNNTTKKTIYYDIVKMAMACNDSNAKQNNEDNDLLLRKLMNIICKSYVCNTDEIFIVLDNKAKLVYCVDDNNVVLDDKQIGEHIVKLTRNSEVLKNISAILDKPKDVINIDVSVYKINITPIKNEEDGFVGIVISGNARKDTL